MLTKTLIAVVMSGALWVAGDAAYQQFGCCRQRSECNTPSPCCTSTPAKSEECCPGGGSDCCAPPSACCLLTAKARANAAQQTGACCEATFVYCTRTDSIYVGCCCEVVNGEHRCLITGETSKECCCIPIE